MRQRMIAIPTGVALALVIWSGLPSAQSGKPKPPPPAPITGSADIRCIGPADVLPDVICGDGQGLLLDGEPGVKVRLGEAGNFLLGLSTDPLLSRSHVVRIPDAGLWDFRDCRPRCVAGIPEGGLTVFTEPRDTEIAYISVTALGSGSLASMADGQTIAANALIGFPDPDPGSGIRWSVYWNPGYYAGTNTVSVTRSGCTWTMTAGETALAGLWLFRVNQGKVRDTQEGRFKPPFEIQFTANPATIPGGC